MEFKFIFDSFRDYGPWLGGSFVAIFLIYKFYNSALGTRLITFLLDSLFERYLKNRLDTQITHITESEIINHDIFNYIDFWKYSKIPTFQFSTDYRTAVFRKYLVIYLKCYKSNLLSFINSKSYQQMDDAQIWKAFLNLMNTTVYEYEREMLEEGIPKIVIDKMKVKNNDTISLTIDLIEGVCNSNFYQSENNYLKVYSILNILLSVLENNIMHSEAVCNSINGQLKGLTFEGKTEP